MDTIPNGNMGLNSGHYLRNIADVRRTPVLVGWSVGLVQSKEPELCRIKLGKNAVDLERSQYAVVFVNFKPTTCSQGCSLCTGYQPFLHPHDLGKICRPYIKITGSPLRDDVGGDTSFSDNAVDPHILAQMLAQGVDPDKGLDDPVQRIDPLLGIDCCMGSLAEKREADPGKPKRRLDHLPFRGRMNHHGKIDSLEYSGLDQLNLANPQFLRRRPENNYPGHARG